MSVQALDAALGQRRREAWLEVDLVEDRPARWLVLDVGDAVRSFLVGEPGIDDVAHGGRAYRRGPDCSVV